MSIQCIRKALRIDREVVEMKVLQPMKSFRPEKVVGVIQRVFNEFREKEREAGKFGACMYQVANERRASRLDNAWLELESKIVDVVVQLELFQEAVRDENVLKTTTLNAEGTQLKPGPVHGLENLSYNISGEIIALGAGIRPVQASFFHNIAKGRNAVPATDAKALHSLSFSQKAKGLSKHSFE